MKPNTKKVVQIVFRGSDDAQHDEWYDICINLLQDDDPIFRVINLFERVGKHLTRHVLCKPRQYSTSDGLSEEELKEIREFNPSIYKSFDIKPGTECVITGRYLIQYD